MRVLFGYVLIKPVTKEKTDAGLFLPDAQQNEAVKHGKIVSIGTGSIAMSGNGIPMEVQPNEEVLFRVGGAQKIKYKGEDHYIIEQRDIFMVL